VDEISLGTNKLEDFTRKQLLDSMACTECGRCTDVCPANIAGMTLSPMKIITDIRQELFDKYLNKKDVAGIVGNPITETELWSCTTCGACMEECPVLIDHIPTFTDMRRYLVLSEGKPHSQAADSLEKTLNTGNPWGYSKSERTKWAIDAGIELPLMSEKKEADVLYWVGCAGAYDPRNQKVAKAMVKILEAANIDYAVLGNEESCTGDSARRLGEEYLFETMALQNIETLNKYKFNKIITPCPHCFHTIGNEYGDFDGNYEVQHHSQFITELSAAKKLKLDKYIDDSITYHDPCYLGRHNGEYEAPRNVISSIINNGELVEMGRNKANSFCCGAGGGNMWYDIDDGERINTVRFQEAIDTGVDVVATACSFCTNMMDDAMKLKDKEDSMKVYDIAEMVAEAL
ncbi:MAG: (Fe-S)-binding protein, partial [Candidatus Neomarinimicrobiota bacterium]